ncbi:hypothetical protein [Aquipuribacter sp. MA13-6]|uniref:hypothetical protein n=1 Tax=unclassified Aquipuribacter TaxID=2635084 RepID=UPI003EEE48B8
MAQTLSSRLLPALVSGAATAAYYATPDVIGSRAARGWAKTGLTVVVLATAVPESLAALADIRRARRDVADAMADAEPVPPRGKAVAVLAGVVAVGGAIAGVVATERWIFRRGQARAAAGQSWPHTRTGLAIGAVAAGLALVPLPPAPEASSHDR